MKCFAKVNIYYILIRIIRKMNHILEELVFAPTRVFSGIIIAILMVYITKAIVMLLFETFVIIMSIVKNNWRS